MFEEKKQQIPTSVPSPATSPQREIVTMPQEFLVKPASNSPFLAWGAGVVFVVVLLGVGVYIMLSPSLVPTPPPEPPITPPVEEPEEPIVVPLPLEDVPSPEVTPPVAPSAAEDPDVDSLTNSEEEIFKTEPQNPDTDGDGYQDGDEVKNLFDPTKPQGALLKDSGVITLVTEERLHWSAWVPSSWVLTLQPTPGNAHLATSLPDAFDITYLANPEALPLAAWYSGKQGPGFGSQATPTITTTRKGVTLIMSPDGLTAYLAKPGTDAMYSIAYKKGTTDIPYFPTIFHMIVESMILP